MNLPLFFLVSLCLRLQVASSFPQEVRRRGGLHELNSADGVTPCGMTSKSAEPCYVPGKPLSPSPSACTCNNVFFNLWSACLLTNGNDTLPRYDEWGVQCRGISLGLKDGYPAELKGNMVLPSWAFINVPATSRFNLPDAMRVANVKEGWTKTQIMLLAMAVVGAIALGIVLFLLYRSRTRKTLSWSPRRIHLLRPRRRIDKIRRADRTGTWSIDPTDDTSGFVIVDQNDARHPKGHYRLTSSDAFLPFDEQAQGAEPEYVPGSRIWNLSTAAQGFRRLSNKVSSIFKPRNRSNRYRIDVFNGTSAQPRPSDLSTSDLRAGRYTQPVPENHLDDEGTSLISPPEREGDPVLLITHHPGVDFKSESSNCPDQDAHKIDVVPATPTTDSGHPLTPPVTPPRPRIAIPPPPKTPPPTPPCRTPPPPLPPTSSTLRRSSHESSRHSRHTSSPTVRGHSVASEYAEYPLAQLERAISPAPTPPPSIPLPPLPPSPSRFQRASHGKSSSIASRESGLDPFELRETPQHVPEVIRVLPVLDQPSVEPPSPSPTRQRISHPDTTAHYRRWPKPKGARTPTSPSQPRILLPVSDEESVETKPNSLHSPSTTESDQKLSSTHYDDPFPHSPHPGCSGPWDGDDVVISKQEKHYLLGSPILRPEGNISFTSIDLDRELERTILLFSDPVQKTQKSVSPRPEGRSGHKS